MNLIDSLHGWYVHERRSRVLSNHLANIIPRGFRVLDVGSGDGLLGRSISDLRPDVTIDGIDVLVRSRTYISTEKYDGGTIPYLDKSYDAVIFVDVLHHTKDPMVLLREAKRIARSTIVIKDHLVNGLFARQTLRFMDHVGNARHGISLPYNYWPEEQWLNAFEALGLQVRVWMTKLKLYPPPATWILDRSLHFVTRVDIV